MAQTERPTALVLENRAPFVVERKPTPEFGELIEKFWDAPRPKDSAPRTFEIFPDGNFDLVFALADCHCRLLFLGPYTKDTYIQLSNSHEYFCVRFRPGLMPRIADIKPAELIDNMIDLPGLLGIETDCLGERLCASPGLEAKKLLMEEIFRKMGPEALLRPNLSSRGAALAESCGGQIQVQELAGLLGTSIRTLERAFLAEVGISPKKFLRLVRFQHAIDRVRNRLQNSLADVAYDCGYADQSHLIREFKDLTGRLPSRL
ncbi:MAG: helix-turn-helix domain-containing protein [Thermodesulfobacteriota bacterium]